MMRWFGWPRSAPDHLIAPGVRVVEEDVTTRETPTSPATVMAVVGSALDGPMQRPTLLSPAMREPRWWQFWQFRRWRRECALARGRYDEPFGKPLALGTGADAEAIAKYLMDDARLDVVRVVQGADGAVSVTLQRRRDDNAPHGVPKFVERAIRERKDGEGEDAE